MIERRRGVARGFFAKAEKEANQMNTQDQRRFDQHLARPISGAVARPDLTLAAGRIVTSDTLFQGSREIGIEHYGALYRLKITRQGKLILNK